MEAGYLDMFDFFMQMIEFIFPYLPLIKINYMKR